MNVQINNMSELRRLYDQLETKVNISFTDLLQDIKESITFKDEEQDTVDVYFESSGNIVSVFVCEIFKSGAIRVQEVEDLVEHIVSIWDLNSVTDKINLVEILESTKNQ